MKNVLLTTTALVAFAGAAAAADVELTYSGDTFVEYDFFTEVYRAEANLTIDLLISQELNNGMVASLSLPASWDYSATGLGDDTTDWSDPSIDWIAKLDTSYGSLSFGPGVGNVNEGVFQEAGPMDAMVDTDNDGSGDDGDIPIYAANLANWDQSDTGDYPQGHDLRVDATVGGFAIAVSTDTDNTDGEYALNVSGSAGAIDFMVLYNVNGDENTMGATASGSFSGLDFNLAYASDSWGEETAIGADASYALNDAISVSAGVASFTDDNGGPGDLVGTHYNVGVDYASGPITAGIDYDVDNNDVAVITAEASYAFEVAAGTTATVGVSYDDEVAGEEFGASIDITHSNGDDWSVYAGANMADEIYAGIVYDLGGGASAYAYYADNATDDAEDLGPKDWDQGTVVGLAMTF